jgi:hypothetical protein
LAELVGARTGKTAEQVIREAVERQARVMGVAIPESTSGRKEVDLDRVRDIIRRVSSRPVLDSRTPKEIRDEVWGECG